MNAVMNGKVLRFKVMNGKRVWIDMPSTEWQKYHFNPHYPNKNETN